MRRPKATQYIPDGPSAPFMVLDPTSRRSEWHFKIRDAICGDEPEFTMPLTTGSKANRRPLTLDEVCRAAFRELNEGRGFVFLTEWRDGVPVFSATVACWPGWSTHNKQGAVPQFRVLRSTDPERTNRELPWHEPPAEFTETQWGRTQQQPAGEQAA